MTIQIDDAGWGCLLGGVLIGAYHLETGAFACAEVPVEHFQGVAFRDRAYLAAGTKVAGRLLVQMGVPADEEIEICTGFVLNGVRDWLRTTEHPFKQVKITGPLQEKVEGELLARLHLLGLKNLDYETLTQKQGLLFWQCLRWLKGGNVNAVAAVPEREVYAKSGWGTYHNWTHYPYEEAKRLNRRQKRELRPW